jgi:hypothetical protein
VVTLGAGRGADQQADRLANKPGCTYMHTHSGVTAWVLGSGEAGRLERLVSYYGIYTDMYIL